MIVPLLLALAAVQSSSASVPHRFGRLFISPMGEPFRATAALDGLEVWFAQADRNHDGILTNGEMQADAERFFAILDLNHDGEIDPDEITHYELDVAPRDRPNLFDLPEPVIAADTDLNRGVSLDEFRKAAMKRFQALDVNHQGRLTVDLLESLGPAKPPREKQQDDPQNVLPE